MATEQLQGADGVPLALHCFGGEGPTALFVHGTSFHARVLAPLARALGGHLSFGLDLRGHGESGRPTDGSFSWASLGADVATALARLQRLAPGPLIGIGHSAGATALLLAAARQPERFGLLYCYEPIVLNDAIREELELPAPLAGAARRRSHFASAGEALKYFANRPPLSGLDPEVLSEYVAHGVVGDVGGGVRLACEPSYEAAIYLAGFRASVLGELVAATCPVAVAVGGESEGIGPACAPLVAGALPRAKLVRVDGVGHLGPLENPGRVSASIITAIETPAT